jgi:hypothetical protein
MKMTAFWDLIDNTVLTTDSYVKGKAIPLHAMEALGGRGIAPTHSRPRH